MITRKRLINEGLIIVIWFASVIYLIVSIKGPVPDPNELHRGDQAKLAIAIKNATTPTSESEEIDAISGWKEWQDRIQKLEKARDELPEVQSVETGS